MKEEKEITEEVQQLLDSLEQHGRNARRQKELMDVIDGLEASSQKHRKLYPLWWIVGAAAACLLLWLLAKPAMKETPNVNEEILVEETKPLDIEENQEQDEIFEESMILEEPIAEEKLMAEETPVKPKKLQDKTTKTTVKTIEEVTEEPILAENNPMDPVTTEPVDTLKTNAQLSNSNSPQRRVIRSLNLVCYECQKEPEYNPQPSTLNPQTEKTIFGQQQDPNMKNGSLAFELKLH